MHTTNKHQFHLIFSSLFILSYTLQNDSSALGQIIYNNIQYSFRSMSDRFWLNIAIIRRWPKGIAKAQIQTFLFCSVILLALTNMLFANFCSFFRDCLIQKRLLFAWFVHFFRWQHLYCEIQLNRHTKCNIFDINTPYLFVLMSSNDA